VLFATNLQILELHFERFGRGVDGGDAGFQFLGEIDAQLFDEGPFLA
jgi:hypothetical protein